MSRGETAPLKAYAVTSKSWLEEYKTNVFPAEPLRRESRYKKSFHKEIMPDPGR